MAEPALPQTSSSRVSSCRKPHQAATTLSTPSPRFTAKREPPPLFAASPRPVRALAARSTSNFADPFRYADLRAYVAFSARLERPADPLSLLQCPSGRYYLPRLRVRHVVDSEEHHPIGWAAIELCAIESTLQRTRPDESCRGASLSSPIALGDVPFKQTRLICALPPTLYYPSKDHPTSLIPLSAQSFMISSPLMIAAVPSVQWRVCWNFNTESFGASEGLRRKVRR